MRLFGSSGIRGVVGDLLTPEFCYQIGQALGSVLSDGSRACIGTDARLSRQMVCDEVTSGLISTGIEVVQLGIVPTPALAWITRDMRFDVGLMITASHNPPEYNGIKVFNQDTIGYSIDQEDEIEDKYRSKGFRVAEVPGKVTQDNTAKEKYIQYLVDLFKGRRFNRDLKIVVDPGNGAASGFAGDLFSRLGINCLTINDTPDGNFPGRPSEPKADTLKGTVEFIRQNGADLAVCFDGDADRVVFCDSEGFLGFTQMVSYISNLKVRDIKHPIVAATVEVGKLLDLVIESLGGKVVRGKVGDVYLAHLVRENRAAIGVEDVGVYIFPQMGWYPESMYAALMLLSEIDSPLEIRDFINRFPALSLHKEKVECPNEQKESLIERIRQQAYSFNPKNVNTIDGIRLEFEDASMLIRASGTEPVIRVMVESTSEATSQKLVKLGTEMVNRLITT